MFIAYWIMKDGKKFAYSTERKQAEQIANTNGGTVEEIELLTPLEEIERRWNG